MDKTNAITHYKTNMPVPDTIRIDPNKYYWYKFRMHERHNVMIPELNRIERANLDILDLRLNQELFTLDFVWKLKKRIHISLKPGFISDLASSPKALRWLVDNDAFIVLIPAFVWHDPAFGLHLVNFKEANEIFRDLIRYIVNDYYKGRMKYLKSYKGDDKRKKVKKLNRWYRKSCRKANIYRFGVDSFVGKKIYNESNYKDHWNVPFVDFTITDYK